MSEIERFDVLVFGSGAGGKLTAWTSASEGLRTAVVERGLRRGIMPEYRLPADEKRGPQREGGRLRPS